MREKLIKLLCEAHSKSTEAACFEDATYAKQLRMEADHLIANGVTIATDNNVGDKKISALEKSNRNWRRKHQRLKAAMRQRWIPVTERLPEVGKKVFCCGPTGGLFIARTRACAGRVLIIDDKSSVQRKATNWMPLPEPPKGE